MPGPVSDQYKGPKGHMPLVPTWMEDGYKAVEPECPICGRQPAEVPCPKCAYSGEKL